MNNFSENLKRAISRAQEIAAESGGLVGTEHILCGIIAEGDSAAAELLAQYNVTKSNIYQIVTQTGEKNPATVLSERVKRAFQKTQALANGLKTEMTCEQVLFVIVSDRGSYAARKLAMLGVDIDEITATLKQIILAASDTNAFDFDLQDGPPQGGMPKFGMGINNPWANMNNAPDEKASKSNGTGIKELDDLGVDLTEKAKQGKLDPVIGRGKEIDRIIQILSRRTKNNPVLIGEPGVGKSAIVEGLAQQINAGAVPEMLKGKKIFSLEMASVLAGTKYRGDFEKKLQDAISAIKKNGDIILFIDEIHTIVGSGSSEGNSIDAANILKPLLSRGELQTVGATTLEEYRKYIEKDSALERRFQPIIVDPPTVEDTVSILKGLREKYEMHHNVMITDEAIQSAAILSDRYISDRFLPDKAIDLIDEACSKKRINNFILPQDLKELEDKINRLELDKKEASKREQYEKASQIKKEQQELAAELEKRRVDWEESKKDVKLSIGEDEIAEIVSAWTSVPVVKLTESEADRLLHLEDVLKKRVIGQDEAVESIAKAVRRARAGLKDPQRPIGSFIFLGPTGVGKTELTKALSEAMFGDENLMIRFDMSEYMDKFNVSKLIGSAPGYVGYEEGGQLTEKVRRKPYSVVLFDEIEKAHPDIFNILLQIMEDGRLTDSHGRTVSFKNTVIIMTSNIGATEINQMGRLGFSEGSESASKGDYEKMKEKQMDALKKSMRPEFINRVDDIIIFHKLERPEVAKIAGLMIQGLSKRLAERDIKIEVTDAAKEYIVSEGYDPQYGARPLRRAVQRLIEDRLSEEILKGTVAIGDTVRVDLKDGTLTFKKA